jgi:hypothetical protein
LYVNGQNQLQTLNTGSTQGSLLLPMAPGAQANNGQQAGKNWNSQSMGHTMTHAQVAKNKDRYMGIQGKQDQKQFFMAQNVQ